jgi:hypothetical protein
MHQRLDVSLDDRRRALDELVASLSTKAEDMDSLLKSFAGLLEDNLASAEARAREVGQVLVESTSQTTAAITAQAETLRMATGKERERTAAVLRQAYEQAMTEMNSLFKDATTRFGEVTGGLRDMSSDIQRELSQTRSELARGLTEMPRETQENAAAMRRVVADQIKALAELNDIVAKSGRAYDVVEPSPVAAPARRAVRDDIPPLPRAASLDLPPRADFGRAEPARRPVEPPVEPRRVAEPAPRREAPRGPSTSTDRGWLSDLLTRASTDDARGEPLRPAAPAARRAPAATSLDSLDALSTDIARMVDHDAVAELWDRWRRGERNVFSRRLYSVQGAQAFDEIKRRYGRDAEFRDTVDRYIEEFQRLLGEVDRSDRDGSLARTYLTSETGKVYTMLVHASGRVG